MYIKNLSKHYGFDEPSMVRYYQSTVRARVNPEEYTAVIEAIILMLPEDEKRGLVENIRELVGHD